MTTLFMPEPAMIDSETNPVAASPSILVVDDSSAARKYIAGLLREHTSVEAFFAANGREGLAILEKQPSIQLVVTDLHMPEMDGLELVQQMRTDYPLIPVILITAEGSEEIAVQALKSGAASYVSKSRLAKELPETIENVLLLAKTDRRRQTVLESVQKLDCDFLFENDPALVPLLVAHLQESMVRMKLCDQNNRIRIGIALEETLLNAIYHGNLELSSDLRQDGSNAYERVAQTRRYLTPYAERRLHVHVRLDSTRAIFIIRDEGPGFDVAKLPDPTDPENMLKASGRGLLLIRTFMDDVFHNSTGNQITLVSRKKK